MRVLDCESIDSIDKSLELITGIPIDKIEDFLIDLDCENMYRKYTVDDDIRDIIAKEVSVYFDVKCDFDETCWFHITRAFSKEDFNRGLLPLSKIIDKIWKDLFNLVAKDFSWEQWDEFRAMVESGSSNCWNAYLYNLKLNKEIGQGPFAMLIKELAFPDHHPNNIDYIDLPEIVRDICECFDKKYKYNLLDLYLANTKKYIIKFKSNDHESFDFGSALIHKYRLLNGMPRESYPVCCFSGQGEPVPPKDILKIEEAATRLLSSDS
jgi:hypothetical protein